VKGYLSRLEVFNPPLKLSLIGVPEYFVPHFGPLSVADDPTFNRAMEHFNNTLDSRLTCSERHARTVCNSQFTCFQIAGKSLLQSMHLVTINVYETVRTLL